MVNLLSYSAITSSVLESLVTSFTRLPLTGRSSFLVHLWNSLQKRGAGIMIITILFYYTTEQ